VNLIFTLSQEFSRREFEFRLAAPIFETRWIAGRPADPKTNVFILIYKDESLSR